MEEHEFTKEVLSYEFTDSALPLLSYNTSQKKYEICETAVQFLKSLKGLISVITVAGLYRTGKSYLLNQVLLGQKSGFGVGPSINPCTKGMWIWGRPLYGKTATGDPCNILVVDTEGIGALDEDSTHDSRIFSLAILFSSCFIYNSVGSIDESALQSMSLVLNLAKHITVKSENQSNEDLHQYFPSFLWVVRDFSLQLVDEHGTQLSSKEYLEKALMPQKGNSEACEEKNKIRTMIKTFFKDRECWTLVRPTTDEAELQHLDRKELETLRPEFISQTKDLRLHILTSLKPKELQGKALNGEMFSDLIESYVNAINSGAAPCIESTWAYLCRNQLAKALQDSEELYEKEISKRLENEFPVPEKKLLLIHKACKRKSIENFLKKAVGDEAEAARLKLKAKIKEKYEAMFLNNLDACKAVCTRFLQENYAVVTQKLKKGVIKTFLEYEKELKILKEYTKSHCPVVNFDLLGDFLVESLTAAGDFFMKNSNNELSLQKEMLKEQIFRLESDLKENRDGFYKEREDLRLKLSSAENEKIELVLKEKSAQEKLNELKSEKEAYEKEYRGNLRNVKVELTEKLEESVKKCWDFEEKIKEIERKAFQTHSDSAQELALYMQKISYLEKTLEECEIREQKALAELKSYKVEHNSAIKEICTRQEEQLLTYQQKIVQEIEKNTEFERQICEKEVENEQIRLKFEESQARLEVLISEGKECEEFNKSRLEQREKFFKQEWERSIEKYENDLQHLRSQLASAETRLKEYENSKLHLNASSSKETAILEQKIEFLEQELRDTKKSLEEEKKHQQHLLASMNLLPAESEKNEIQEEIQILQQKHGELLKQKEENFNSVKEKLENELAEYKEIVEELEIQNKVNFSQKTGKELEMAEEVENLRNEKTRLMEKLRNLNKEYSTFVEESEAKTKAKSRELEEKSENLINYYAKENVEIKNKHEEVISQLKKYCEEDKARNDSRLREERERAEKKYLLACEEYEKKQQEEQEHYECEISNLQQELRELHERYSSELQHFRHKSDFDSQKIETLERYLSSTKDQIASIQNAQAQSLDTHLQAFNGERAGLLDKIERLASELAGKERENSNYTFRVEQAQARASLKEKELEELKEQYNRDKGLFLERLEAAKQANHKLADEISQKKSDYKREIALANQHIEFQCKKIADLEKALQESTAKYSDNFKSWKNESGIEFTETIEKLNSDKETSERKLEESKKKLKDSEMRFAKQINLLEKEKNLLSEKLSLLENKKSETEKRLQEELKDLKSQLTCSKDFDVKGRSIYLVENEKLKERCNDLEKSLVELGSSYERDKVLWENKFAFLVQQRDQARSDLVDSQEKFDVALERLQKRGSLDRDKVGNATASLISSVEVRYSTQIKEIHEKYTATITDLTQKNKALERELRSLKEDYEVDKRTRSSDSGSQGKRLQELLANEKRLQSELEDSKALKDQKVKELLEMFKGEKEIFKGKVLEHEQKIKDLEHNKGQLFLQHEKERAKWALERDHLISLKNEAQDIVDSLEKRKETLLRENEKLKATRGRISSSKIDSLASVNKSYMNGILSSNISFDEVTKEVKTNTCSSPGSAHQDLSPMPLRFKNYENSKLLSSCMGEISRKPRRNFDENSRS